MTVDSSMANTRFIHYYLRSPEARSYLMTRASGASSTMKKISKQVVQSLAVPLPPISQQTEVINRLNSLETLSSELATNTRSKLSALDELKKSLLHQAFSGQL